MRWPPETTVVGAAQAGTTHEGLSVLLDPTMPSDTQVTLPLDQANELVERILRRAGFGADHVRVLRRRARRLRLARPVPHPRLRGDAAQRQPSRCGQALGIVRVDPSAADRQGQVGDEAADLAVVLLQRDPGCSCRSRPATPARSAAAPARGPSVRAGDRAAPCSGAAAAAPACRPAPTTWPWATRRRCPRRRCGHRAPRCS